MKTIITLLAFLPLIVAGQTVSSAVYNSDLTVTEQLSGSQFNTDKAIVHNGFNNSVRFTGASTPDVDYVYSAQLTIAAVDSLDLYDGLTTTQGTAISATGKEVHAIKLSCPSTNSDSVVVTENDVSGYELLGDAWKFTLKPGQEVLVYTYNSADTIGSGNAFIQYSGTAADKLNVVLILGD